MSSSGPEPNQILRGKLLYNDGLVAKTHRVSMVIDGHDLILADVESGTELATYALEGIRLAEEHRGRAGWICLELDETSVARLTIYEGDAITAIKSACPDLKKGTGKRNEWVHFSLWGGGAVLSVLLLFFVVLPAFSDIAVEWIPDALEQEIGEGVEKSLVSALVGDAGEAPYCSSEDGTDVLNKLSDTLSITMGLESKPVVSVLRYDLPNAVALPGNRVILFSSLFELEEHPDVITGIMAHEFGHLKEQHSMRMGLRAIGVAAILGLLLGDVTGSVAIVGLSQHLLNTSYSREFEAEADRIALEALNDLNTTSEGLAGFMRLAQNMEDGHFLKLPEILKTHPNSLERADYFETQGSGTGSALTQAEWATLSRICD